MVATHRLSTKWVSKKCTKGGIRCPTRHKGFLASEVEHHDPGTEEAKSHGSSDRGSRAFHSIGELTRKRPNTMTCGQPHLSSLKATLWNSKKIQTTTNCSKNLGLPRH